MGWTFEKVTQPIVILGEGRDEAELLGALVKHLGLHAQCADCGGRIQFHARLKAVMKAPGFSRVSALGIVRDAEDDAAGASASVKSCLQAEALAVPDKPMQRARLASGPDTAFVIVPHDSDAGMMEDLVLRALEDDPSWPCQNAYFECLRAAHIDLRKDYKKRMVQAGLAALTGDGVARNIGEAAQKGLLPLDHPAFSELCSLLTMLADD